MPPLDLMRSQIGGNGDFSKARAAAHTSPLL